MAGEVEVERLLVRLVGDASSYQRMLADAQLQAQKSTQGIVKSFARMAASVTRSLRLAGVSLTRFGRRIQGVGRAMALKLTAPIILGFGGAIKAFADFDKAMIESTSIMSVTAKQTKEMTDLALRLGTEGIKGPRDIAQAYFFLASAGKNAEQSMALLPPLLDFATAGAFDLALATDLLTDAQSALGLTSKDAQQDMRNMTRLSDLLVGANTLANASVEQFSVALTSKAGSAIKAYNIVLEDGIALLAAYADQGIKAELAGNAFDRVVRLLTQAYADNSKAFEDLNIKIFEGGEFRRFADIIEDIEIATQDMSTEMRAAALTALGFNARVQGVILPLLGSSQAIRGYRTELEKMGGITSSVAAKQLKAFSNQLIIIKNQIVSVAIDIGKILSPMILKLTERVKKAVEWWKALTQSVKEVIVRISLIVAAIGPALIVIGGLVIFIGAAVTAFSALITPVGAIIAAMVALAVGIGAVIAKIVGAEGLKAAWESAVKSGQRFVMNTLTFLADFRENISLLRTWLLEVWTVLGENFQTIFIKLSTNILHNISVLVKGLAASWISLYGFVFSATSTFFSQTLPNLIKKTLETLIPVFVKFAMVIGKVFREAILPKGVMAAFLRGEGIVGAFKAALKGEANETQKVIAKATQDLASFVASSFTLGMKSTNPFSAMTDAFTGEMEKMEKKGEGFVNLFAGIEGIPGFPTLFGERERELKEARKFGEKLGELINRGRNVLLGQTNLQERIDAEREIFETAIKGVGDLPAITVPVRFTTVQFAGVSSFATLEAAALSEISAAKAELEVGVKKDGLPKAQEKDQPAFWLERIWNLLDKENERLKREPSPFIEVAEFD